MPVLAGDARTPRPWLEAAALIVMGESVVAVALGTADSD
jgi:hypothetical protein